MNEYYHGTSAYKLEDYENHAQESERRQKERKASIRAQQIAFCRFLTIAVIVVFIAASALVYVNVMALRASTDIENLEHKLAMVIDQNKQKEIEINRKLDMKVIEKRAVEKLGMQKPDNSQIVYVDVRKENHTEIVTPEKGKSGGVIAVIKQLCINIWEYFN